MYVHIYLYVARGRGQWFWKIVVKRNVCLLVIHCYFPRYQVLTMCLLGQYSPPYFSTIFFVLSPPNLEELNLPT